MAEFQSQIDMAAHRFCLAYQALVWAGAKPHPSYDVQFRNYCSSFPDYNGESPQEIITDAVHLEITAELLKRRNQGMGKEDLDYFLSYRAYENNLSFGDIDWIETMLTVTCTNNPNKDAPRELEA